MPWLLLFWAGILEAGWLVAIYKSNGFTQFWYSLCAVASMALSLMLFAISIQKTPITQAYLVWLGIGAVSLSVINHYHFQQSLSMLQLACLCLIFIGVTGLKFTS